MGSSEVEICSNCKREIDRSEQAHVFEGKIVCIECDRKLRMRSGSRLPTASPQFQPSPSSRPKVDERETEERGLGTGKKMILFLSVASVLVLAVCIALYFFLLHSDRPGSEAVSTIVAQSGTPEAKPSGWPFRTEVPEGFQFERREEWKGRTFWILKGEQFGQARETVIVVQGLSRNDWLRSLYWAAELCVNLPIDASGLTQRQIDLEGWKFGGGQIPFKNFDGQYIFSTPWEKSNTFGPTTSYDMSKIPLDELGRPEGFVPDSVCAWAGPVIGSPFVFVAWAGDSKASDYPDGPDTGEALYFTRPKLVAQLCKKLREEPASAFRPKPAKTLKESLSEVIPDNYSFRQQLEQDGVMLLTFNAEKTGRVRDTLVVARWQENESFRDVPADEPFMALTNCARWAAELSLERPLSKRVKGFSSNIMAFLEKNDSEGYSISYFLKENQSFTFGMDEHLLALGEQIQGTPRLYFEDSDEDADEPPIYVSTVSRAIQLEAGGFLVFAGAAAGTKEAFWYITQTVDKWADAWKELARAEF